MYFCPFCGTLLLLEKPDAFRFYCTACSYRLPVPTLSVSDLRLLAKSNRPLRSAAQLVKTEPTGDDGGHSFPPEVTDEHDDDDEHALFPPGLLSSSSGNNGEHGFAPLTISHKEQFLPFHKQPEDSFFQGTNTAEGSQVTTVRCESAANGVYMTVPARVTSTAEDFLLKPEEVLGGKKAAVKMETRECESNKAYFVQLQMRSADEPPTTFFKCVVCGFQWRAD